MDRTRPRYGHLRRYHSNEAAVAARRNQFLARAYAAAGRYSEAADTLLAIPVNQNYFVSRESVLDAARLLRGAPDRAGATDPLPAFVWGQVDFVYAYIGAVDRVLDDRERTVESGNLVTTVTTDLWHPVYAPLRKTERFKTLARKLGLVDYWRERGWPDLCRPIGADDFVCD